MIEVNYTGLACPEPVIQCKKFLADSKPENLHVIVDNEPASENIKRFLKTSGYTATIHEENSKRYVVQASLDPNFQPAPIEEKEKSSFANNSDSYIAKTMFLIPSDVMGSGDDILGQKLMENFLSTLYEMADNILKIVLVNGGVKLAVNEGKALDALQALEKSGIEILVCGSCLEFYGLTKLKKVGESTNMLDIVTSIDLADKVVRV